MRDPESLIGYFDLDFLLHNLIAGAQHHSELQAPYELIFTHVPFQTLGLDLSDFSKSYNSTPFLVFELRYFYLVVFSRLQI